MFQKTEIQVYLVAYQQSTRDRFLMISYQKGLFPKQMTGNSKAMTHLLAPSMATGVAGLGQSGL